jgi:hypothetical protein
MFRQRPPDTFRPEQSPIAWFGEMLIAIDRGDFEHAAESQRQLDRLGWRMTRKQSRPESRQATAGQGGGV